MIQRPGLRAGAPVLALLLLDLGCASESGAPPPLAAEVAGRSITLDQVDRRIRDDLFERETRGSPSRLYEIRSAALERMIEEAVLEAEGARRGLAPDALLQAELASRGQVTSEEVAAFYAENARQLGGATLEQAEPRIRDYLAAQRAREALTDLLERSDVRVHLTAPRLDVTAVGPSLGPPQARVTIVEFSDFQCPYCQRSSPVLKEVLARYPDDVRLVYRHLPLDNLHPRARAAAEASLCADDQDRFWPFHDRLFQDPRALSEQDLVGYAGDLGLDVARFRRCVAEHTFQGRVQEDADAAKAAGISGTPAFLVNGILLSGARPASAFVQLIDQELAQK